MNLDNLSGDKPQRNVRKTKPPKRVSERRVSERNPKKTLFYTLLSICIVGFLATTGSLIWYYSQAASSEKVFAEYTPKDKFDIKDFEKNKMITYVDVQGINVWDRYVDGYLKNNDCIGWIKIPGTKIDYPVAFTMESEDYYLHRNLDKEYSSQGTIFADSNADMNTLSNNVVLYGHHMRNGSMFAGLESFDDKDFVEKHKYIYFDTINGHQKYEIVSTFRISANDDFRYASFNIAKDDKETEEWISSVLSKSYLTDKTAEVSDKFITLSTCDYYRKDGRFVVVAKQVENSEDYEKEYITLEEYNQRSENTEENSEKEEGK